LFEVLGVFLHLVIVNEIEYIQDLLFDLDNPLIDFLEVGVVDFSLILVLLNSLEQLQLLGEVVVVAAETLSIQSRNISFN